MSTINIKRLRYLVLFVAILSVGAISSSNASAASTFDTYTDGDGVVWDRETTDGGDIYIGIQSVPSGVTTVNVPSINDAASGKDTYFLDAICSRYSTPDCSGVVSSTANVTKLDMTNTSKIQVKNVSQMFDTNHEVELVFGENMVIADPADLTITYDDHKSVPDSWDPSRVDAYIDAFDTVYVNGTAINALDNPYESFAGAFEGMKVKLTNLGNIKYIGWNAFRNATLNSESRSITIGNQTIGGYAFANTNITSFSINTNVPQGVAKDCASLSSLTIGDNVNTIYGAAFENTTALAQVFNSKNVTEIYGRAFKGSGITGVSFGAALETIGWQAFNNTDLGDVALGDGVKYVKDEAFANAGVDSIDLKNVERIGTMAFNVNNITELYMPKSIKGFGDIAYYKSSYASDYSRAHIGTALFGNNPIIKLTMAFDLYTNETARVFKYTLGCSSDLGWIPCDINLSETLEELTLIAPYGENEAGSNDKWNGSISNTYARSVVESSKNIIGQAAFYDFWGLKKITIGEGYEFISPNAFFLFYGHAQYRDRVEELSLPSTLRGIDYAAFQNTFINSSVTLETLPANLEYIGGAAFFEDHGLTINNIDLPKLKYLGESSFYFTKIKNLALRDSLEYIGAGQTFVGINGDVKLENIIFDLDIFGGVLQSGKVLNGVFGYINNSVGGNGWSYFNEKYPDWYRMVAPYYWEYTDTGSFLTSKSRYGKITFTEKAVTAPNASSLHFLNADEIDMSQTPWTSLGNTVMRQSEYTYDDSNYLVGVRCDTLKLPSNLKTIGANGFYRAEVTNPIVLPDTLEEIGWQAFAAGYEHSDGSPNYGRGVAIANLPTSIKKIGDAAFLLDARFTADVDLPNLEYLGFSAFQGTSVRDVTLHDSITNLGYNAFYQTPSLRNVTIDVDLYGDGIEREYGNKNYVNITYCWKQSGQPCDGATDEEQMAQRDANFYDSFVATFGDQTNHYGTLTFTAKAGEPCDGFSHCSNMRPYFYGIKADKIDLSATNWTTTSYAMFQDAEVGEVILPHALTNIAEFTFYNINEAAADEDSDAEPVAIAIPSSLKTISYEGFQYARAEIDGLPEGLLSINTSALYGADVTDNLVIPSTVTFIGPSAFNAGPEDVHYDTITIKPNLSMSSAAGQLIHQMFWNVDVDKLIINSSELPATNLDLGDDAEMQEFWHMPIEEVVITNLSKITVGAFDGCTNLKKADLSSDGNLRTIATKAFIGDSKLDEIYFAPAIKNEVVTVGSFAFKGTAFKTMGDNTKQFDLSAAKFDASAGSAFAEMPLLETLDVPRTFSNLTIPVATFANDPELRIVNIDYKLDTIDDHAFSNDNKLESIFIWGNTQVEDSVIAGHGASTDGENGVYGGVNDQGRGAGEYGPTIPEPTDIYAYSTSRAEDYAALPVRGTFEGDFYPLDEVLYLTSNKPTVLVNDDATDFDKSDLVVYAMRRDGIILESDEWATYDDNAYPRATSSIDFESMAQAIQDNPVFASIHDTPVPMDELDISTNVNFANIDFAMVPDPDDSSVRKITLLYNDKYTAHLADTDILPYQEGDEEEPVVPDTGANKIMKNLAAVALPVVTIVSLSMLAGVYVFKKRRE